MQGKKRLSNPVEFLRRRGLGYRLPSPPARQPRNDNLAMELLRIGVNLNQWTHHVNAGGIPPVDLLPRTLIRINAILDKLDGPDDNEGGEEL